MAWKDIIPNPDIRYHFACGCVTPEIINTKLKKRVFKCPAHGNDIDYITKPCVDCGEQIKLQKTQLIRQYCEACRTRYMYARRKRRYKRAIKNINKVQPHPLPPNYNDSITQPITRSPCINCSVHTAGLDHDNITCHHCPKRLAYSVYLASDPLEQLGLINTKYGSDPRHQVLSGKSLANLNIY